MYGCFNSHCRSPTSTFNNILLVAFRQPTANKYFKQKTDGRIAPFRIDLVQYWHERSCVMNERNIWVMTVYRSSMPWLATSIMSPRHNVCLVGSSNSLIRNFQPMNFSVFPSTRCQLQFKFTHRMPLWNFLLLRHRVSVGSMMSLSDYNYRPTLNPKNEEVDKSQNCSANNLWTVTASSLCRHQRPSANVISNLFYP